MRLPTIIFFGTPDYSLIVLNTLRRAGFPIVGVVTKPARPVGRKQITTPTPVAAWAKEHHITALTPPTSATSPWVYENEAKITKDILNLSPDILIVADYAQLIPQELINQVPFGGLNVHPSLLPKYRGPAPVPWAIFNGETETGVSLVTLTQEFDAGIVIAQEKEPILNTDTTHTLLTKLFEKGADLLLKILPNYIKNPSISLLPTTNNLQPSYTPRLTREHGFEPWENIQKALETGKNASDVERKWRAFHPWPGLWTKINAKSNQQKAIGEKRLKILKCHLSPIATRLLLRIDQIQFEGKKPETIDKNHKLLY